MFLLAAEAKQIQMLAEHGILKYEKASIHSPSPTPFTPFSYININIIRSDPIRYIYPKSTARTGSSHMKMSILSAIFCCLSKSKVEDKKSPAVSVAVEAGSLSRKPKADPHPSSPPIVVSYFPLNSHPSRL